MSPATKSPKGVQTPSTNIIYKLQSLDQHPGWFLQVAFRGGGGGREEEGGRGGKNHWRDPGLYILQKQTKHKNRNLLSAPLRSCLDSPVFSLRGMNKQSRRDAREGGTWQESMWKVRHSSATDGDSVAAGVEPSEGASLQHVCVCVCAGNTWLPWQPEWAGWRREHKPGCC